MTVLPNQPGFDWARVRALPEVAALTEFPVVFGFALKCCPDASTGFPPADDQMARTIERPVMFHGRMFNPIVSTRSWSPPSSRPSTASTSATR